jgi:hypothetical protein
MEATLFEGIIKRLSETSEAGLSFNEIEALKFLREETRKQAEIYKAFTDGINSKKWDLAISNFILFTQRVNMVLLYLLQPTNVSLLVGSKISNLIEEYLSTVSLSLSSSLLLLRPYLKEMGIESITASLSSNPPSLNVSMVIKSA